MTTAWIVAGGPSLRAMDMSFLRDRWVIAVNRAHEIVHDAQRLDIYWSDWRFWDLYQSSLKTRLIKVNARVSLNSCPDPAHRQELYPEYVRIWKMSGAFGLDTQRPNLRHGNSSGHAALNLAYHLGARRMFLLGYDMKLGEDGAGHWHEEYPWGDMRARTLRTKILPCFTRIAWDLSRDGVQVVNCNPESAMEFFPKMPVAAALSLV